MCDMCKKGYRQTKEHRDKLSVAMKGKRVGKKNPMYGRTGKRNPMYGVHRFGESNPMWGKHQTEESNMKNSLSHKGKHTTKETRKKQSDAHKGKMAGEKHPLWGKHHTPESNKKNSDNMKKRWKDPGYSEKVIRNTLQALMKRPSSYEKKIIDLCKEYNLPFRYVGDGQIIMCWRNPDFIETNGKKLIIEVGARYHHRDNRKSREDRNTNKYMKSRSEIFAKYGFKTLFLWEEDIEDENWKEICLSKIQTFMEGGGK